MKIKSKILGAEVKLCMEENELLELAQEIDELVFEADKSTPDLEFPLLRQLATELEELA